MLCSWKQYWRAYHPWQHCTDFLNSISSFEVSFCATHNTTPHNSPRANSARKKRKKKRFHKKWALKSVSRLPFCRFAHLSITLRTDLNNTFCFVLIWPLCLRKSLCVHFSVTLRRSWLTQCLTKNVSYDVSASCTKHGWVRDLASSIERFATEERLGGTFQQCQRSLHCSWSVRWCCVVHEDTECTCTRQ